MGDAAARYENRPSDEEAIHWPDRIRRFDARLKAFISWREERVHGRTLWFRIALAVTGVLVGYTVVTALGAQLDLMHPIGDAGHPLNRLFHGSARQAVSGWWAFWNGSGDASLRETVRAQFRQPRSLARQALLVDTIVLVPSYVYAGVTLLLREHQRPLTEAHLCPLLRWVGVAILFLAIFDVAENLLTWTLVDRYWQAGPPGRTPVDAIVGFLSGLKVVLAAFVLITFALVAFTRWKNRNDDTRLLIRLSRAQLGATVVVLLTTALPFQLPDVILRMGWGQALVTVVLAVTLAAALWSGGRLIVIAHARRPEPVAGGQAAPRWLSFLLAAPFLILALVLRDFTPLVPVTLIIVVVLLGYPLRAQTRPRPAPPGPKPGAVAAGAAERPDRSRLNQSAGLGRALPRALAAVSVGAVAVAVLKAAVNLSVQRGRLAVLWPLFGILLVVAVLSVWLLPNADRALDPEPDPDESSRPRPRRRLNGYRAVFLVATVVAIGMSVAQLVWPVTGPQRLGALGVVLTFVILVAVLCGGAVYFADWWVDRHDLPPMFAAFRLRAIPVFTMLLVWAIAAAAIDDGEHWNVRTQRMSVTDTGVSLESAFQGWLNHARMKAVSTGAGPTPIPMVIVATSGGGIRAAYWTAIALDCIFSGRKASTAPPGTGDPCQPGEGRPVSPSDLFLASGISGGSLGLVAWDANRELGAASSPDWVEARLGADDFVSPSLARALLLELPRSLIHFKAADRAEILEQAWEDAWGQSGDQSPMGKGFLASQRRSLDTGGPLLLLNGASVFDGCTVNVSILQAGSSARGDPTDCLSVSRYTDRRRGPGNPGPLPATADIVDYLGCKTAKGEDKGRMPTDLPRSTAALLSARWPYISPAGRIAVCDKEQTARYVVDGGYVDTSAAETAVAIWDALEPLILAENQRSDSCVVPYFIQLDNGYLSSGSPTNKTKPPNQILAPPLALLSTTGLQSRASRARAMAAEQFTKPFGTLGTSSRYSIVVPKSHPGLEAPLAWTLAETSRRDLERELYTGNQKTIAGIRAFLQKPSCPTPATPPSPAPAAP